MSSFTPSSAIDMSKERDWAAQIGMLDWDSTNIVFTKRSLIEFLRYAGVTVDPNFQNVQKLPRYAQFGKIGGDANTAEQTASEPKDAPAASAGTSDDFKPTRRVREPPGGARNNIFHHDIEDDALAMAPPKPVTATAVTAESEPKAEDEPVAASSNPMKSRRTGSGVAGLWDAPDEETFKPTRRVREGPGGKDSISGLW